MINLVPLSELTGVQMAVPIAYACPICHNEFPSEAMKAEHLEHVHPNWAMTMMFAYLRQIPRENG